MKVEKAEPKLVLVKAEMSKLRFALVKAETERKEIILPSIFTHYPLQKNYAIKIFNLFLSARSWASYTLDQRNAGLG